MIGFIGGTGPEGRGLALRFVLAGEQVLIGSRDEDRAVGAAASVAGLVSSGTVSGALNEDVARRADLVFVAVPYAAQRETLEAAKDDLAGKIVVEVVAPLAFRKGIASVVPVAEGSAALEAQAILPDSTVVAAFQTISARDLLAPDKTIDADVVVCADDPEAREKVMRLAETISGIRAVNGGALSNACHVEHLTALLLNINRLYRARSAIRIVGI